MAAIANLIASEAAAKALGAGGSAVDAAVGGLNLRPIDARLIPPIIPTAPAGAQGLDLKLERRGACSIEN
jgi:hypothetical protein